MKLNIVLQMYHVQLQYGTPSTILVLLLNRNRYLYKTNVYSHSSSSTFRVQSERELNPQIIVRQHEINENVSGPSQAVDLFQWRPNSRQR